MKINPLSCSWFSRFTLSIWVNVSPVVWFIFRNFPFRVRTRPDERAPHVSAGTRERKEDPCSTSYPKSKGPTRRRKRRPKRPRGSTRQSMAAESRESRGIVLVIVGQSQAARVSLSPSRVGLRRRHATASCACLFSYRW